MFESYKKSPKILTILIQTVIFGLDMLLLKKANDLLLQLTTSFTGNDLHHRDFLLNSFINNVIQSLVYFPAFIVDVVEVEFKFGQNESVQGY